MQDGFGSGVAGRKAFKDPRDECGRHKKRKQANHQAFKSADYSKYLKKEKKHVVRNYGGMSLVQGE